MEHTEDFIFRPCTLAEVPQMAALEEETFARLERPELLRHNGSEVFARCVEMPHTTMGAFCAQKLVAFAILYVPDSEGENLSLLLDWSTLPRPADVRELLPGAFPTANYKLCIVAQPFRGNGLQYRLGTLLEAEARRQGIRLLCSTVSPLNPASSRSLERLGFHVDRCISKYGFDRLL